MVWIDISAMIYAFLHLTVSTLEFPSIILSVETDELGIAAGLQDRVIQCYGGLVFMDFSNVSS